MSEVRPGGTGDDGSAGAADGGSLCSPARLRALERAGLGPEPDPDMEFYAGWIRRALDVPVALVSLVQADQQVFPGMSGLPEPWATKRSTPLSHSFCRHVVITAQPLVIADTRAHPLGRDNLAVPELGVAAYAGVPLTDEAGNVLGSLCAIDTEPRTWTAEELETLLDVARACSTDLRLRLARFDASQEGDRRDEFEQAQRRAYERSQTLLLASQAFTDTRTMEDVRARIGDLLTVELNPAYVGVVLLDERGRLRRLDPGAGEPMSAATRGARRDASLTQVLPLDAPLPSVVAIRERRIVHHLERDDFDRRYPAQTQAVLRDLGLHSVVAVPLPGGGEPIGAVVLGWSVPHAVEPADLLTIAAIAGYAGQALDRARVLYHRISVAHELQNAMLTTLPRIDGLPMAARYEPADARENVGGDWFDAAPLFDAEHPDEQILAVSVGDIVGHTLHAATIMGQVRSMLRQSAWDHPGGPPSLILGAFETASLGLGLTAAGTTVVAHLRRDRARRWTMTWTNAGHPPPILLLPEGGTELLSEHDALFGFALTSSLERRDHRRDIAPGTTLFLYTDGLVERRDSDLDAGTDALLAVLDEVRDRPPQEIVDVAVTRLAADSPDDVVAFAIRFPAPGD
jgi:GAF domain-containing protein